MSLGPTNFKLIEGMLKGELLDFLGVYAYSKADSPNAIPTVETHGYVDDQVPNTPAWNDDIAMQILLNYFLHDMKEYTGVDIVPTYSYLRVYKNGDVLKPHIDKEACEYSVSITLKREGKDDIWPLCLETDKKYKVLLEEGDGLVYKGIENSHWRDRFEGERLAQVFLHYIKRPQNG
jgi:alkylated DNA repair dioxygenase AlkB